MGLLWGLLTFMTHLVCGNSNYHEDSIEWCDKVWRSMRNTERGEARLCQIETSYIVNSMSFLMMA